MSNEANERGLMGSKVINDFLHGEADRLAKSVVDGILSYLSGKDETVTLPVFIFGKNLSITISGKVDEA